MILEQVFIIAGIILIIEMVLVGIAGTLLYQQFVPLITRKLSENKPETEWQDTVLTALKQVAQEHPESKKFMLKLKTILITKRG